MHVYQKPSGKTPSKAPSPAYGAPKTASGGYTSSSSPQVAYGAPKTEDIIIKSKESDRGTSDSYSAGSEPPQITVAAPKLDTSAISEVPKLSPISASPSPAPSTTSAASTTLKASPKDPVGLEDEGSSERHEAEAVGDWEPAVGYAAYSDASLSVNAPRHPHTTSVDVSEAKVSASVSVSSSS